MMDYEGALCVLNSLQNNAGVLERLKARQDNPGVQFQAMQGFLHRTDITVGELDKLNIIHVTGTKGKGSTCAFIERILRNYGFRTGFYSSPHLVHVRERIRINGWPISKKIFNKYFWEVYERLEDTKDIHGGSMPFYFQLLTLLAFHVFQQERVDLAVIEVGIGGEYDCTNIIRNPWVCGVTSLGFDHCSLLGDTVEKIAWQKAGIFKPGVPAFTVRQQAGPLRVLQDRAEQIGCPLWVCPELDQYESAIGPVSLGLAGKHQRLNASLAMQLSYSWLQRHEAVQKGDDQSLAEAASRPGSQAVTFQPSTAMLQGLKETQWLGRNQTLRHGSVTYYLDGAHTTASIQACVRWFIQETLQRDQTRGPGIKILLFNTTGERDSASLLRLLVPCQFDYALFCPNITETPTDNTAQRSASVNVQHMLARCRAIQSSWQSLNTTEIIHRHLLTNCRSHSLVFPCIVSALQWINQGTELVSVPAGSKSSCWIPPPESTDKLREASHISVLVTGSLHLVGGVLKHLEPSLDS
ncbi:folylpolyglutamate synthase, mitochondrial-like isoform X2 [Scomber scombrus]|uniref:folylpolyglutamate synthase, mitochondrial-like isoform X2 n=1 Tax=Scomber scombrus TaxID=13677 RepID=UPI002DD99CA0|nr:folylpolyglutamate synthase, mitochondrial-like isoform X2 [Scomber scombrus]